MPRHTPILSLSFALLFVLELRAQQKSGIQKKMQQHIEISCQQAIEKAFYALKPNLLSAPGDVVAEHNNNRFLVIFVLPEAAAQGSAQIVRLTLSDSGEVLSKSEQKGTKPDYFTLVSADLKPFLSAKRAYDLALEAVNGFQEYDKMGRFSVELRDSVYYVTFPLLVTSDMGSRRPEYAMQIQIDAQSGKVLKKLVAS